jgi:hypothetical protein
MLAIWLWYIHCPIDRNGRENTEEESTSSPFQLREGNSEGAGMGLWSQIC